MLVPSNSNLIWTQNGVMVVTDYVENGPDPASTERAIFTDRDAFGEYMQILWGRNADVFDIEVDTE